MLRSLVDEVVRRRLWPIPLVALLVAVAAPLLFMKSAPTNATTAPPAAPAPQSLPGGNPVPATDREAVSKKPSKRKAKDPFAPPSGSASKSSATAASAGSASSGTTSSAQAVPVVITNANGTTSTATIAPSTSSSAKSSTSKSRSKTKAKSSTSKPKTPSVTVPKATSSTSAKPSSATYVDVQFGERMGTMTRYRVPRLQTFRAGGKVAAMFVGYSVTRNAAVFAVAPSTTVRGVTCREVKGVCRYVDLPNGAHARLALRGADGELVSRRLEVVNIRRLPKVAGSTASARMTTLPAAKCLLKSLLALSASAPSIATDSCE